MTKKHLNFAFKFLLILTTLLPHSAHSLKESLYIEDADKQIQGLLKQQYQLGLQTDAAKIITLGADLPIALGAAYITDIASHFYRSRELNKLDGYSFQNHRLALLRNDFSLLTKVFEGFCAAGYYFTDHSAFLAGMGGCVATRYFFLQE